MSVSWFHDVVSNQSRFQFITETDKIKLIYNLRYLGYIENGKRELLTEYAE